MNRDVGVTTRLMAKLESIIEGRCESAVVRGQGTQEIPLQVDSATRCSWVALSITGSSTLKITEIHEQRHNGTEENMFSILGRSRVKMTHSIAFS